MNNNKLLRSCFIMLFICCFILFICHFMFYVVNFKLEKTVDHLEQEISIVNHDLSSALGEIDILTEGLEDLTAENQYMEETIDDLNFELSIAYDKIENMENTGVPVYFTDEEIGYIAKTVWGEARGCTKIQQSAVVWCILNRLEDGYWGDTIKSVVTYPGQFHGYSSSFPVTDEIRELVEDVILRWNMEKNGLSNVGRTLPDRFLYFHSDGTGFSNIFTTYAGSGEVWTWDCWNPYE